jgi:predicted ATPase
MDNQVLNELFRYHDELSYDVVFNQSDEARQDSFIRAETLRELTRRVVDTIPDGKRKEKLIDAIAAHGEAFASKLFYNRKLNLEE